MRQFNPLALHHFAAWEDDDIQYVKRPTEVKAIEQAAHEIVTQAKTRGRLSLNFWEHRVFQRECALKQGSRTLDIEKALATEFHMQELEVVILLQSVSEIERARTLLDMPPLAGKRKVVQPVLQVMPRVRGESKSYRHKASWRRAA